MQVWKEHPVRSAFVLGSGLGLIFAIFVTTVCAMQGARSWISTTMIATLWPTSIFGFGFGNSGTSPFAKLAMAVVEFGGNALLYGFVFAAPVGMVVTARKAFGKPEQLPSIKPH